MRTIRRTELLKYLGTEHPTGVRNAGGLAGADCGSKSMDSGAGGLGLSLDTVNYYFVWTAFNLTFPVWEMSWRVMDLSWELKELQGVKFQYRVGKYALTARFTGITAVGSPCRSALTVRSEAHLQTQTRQQLTATPTQQPLWERAPQPLLTPGLHPVSPAPSPDELSRPCGGSRLELKLAASIPHAGLSQHCSEAAAAAALRPGPTLVPPQPTPWRPAHWLTLAGAGPAHTAGRRVQGVRVCQQCLAWLGLRRGAGA